jgi:hypothetical protein
MKDYVLSVLHFCVHAQGRDACRVACCHGDEIVAGNFPGPNARLNDAIRKNLFSSGTVL